MLESVIEKRIVGIVVNIRYTLIRRHSGTIAMPLK
jgi:hypothetical protein